MEGNIETKQKAKGKQMTTMDQLKLILETINARFDAIEDRITNFETKLETTVYGNGKPGLLVTSAQHQKDLEDCKKEIESVKKSAKEKDPYAWKNILILVVLLLVIHMTMTYLIPPEKYWEIILKIIL